MGHRNFCCDGCQTHSFHGRRFHCLRCVNYDLCRDCYDHHVETLDHRNEHPMQLLLDQDQQQTPSELVLNGDLVELIHLPNCYTCPYCGIFGNTAKELIDHVVTMHRQADSHVVCPMCAGLPGIQLVAIRNLARHLLLNHIEHANLLDPHTPPLRHALTRVSRRRRRQHPQNPTNQNSNSRSSARSNSSRMESEAGIDILYQLSELRRLRPDLRLTQNPAQYLDGVVARPTTLAISSAEAPEQGCSNEAEGCSGLLTESAYTDRSLLQQWMAEQQDSFESALQDNNQRQQHAYFAEHLLLSMLCEEQLEQPEPLEHQIKLQLQQEKSEHSLEQQHYDDASLSCKYIPSQIMMLMSLPWIRNLSTHSKLRYIELQGVTLDESPLTDAEQQDID